LNIFIQIADYQLSNNYSLEKYPLIYNHYLVELEGSEEKMTEHSSMYP